MKHQIRFTLSNDKAEMYIELINSGIQNRLHISANHLQKWLEEKEQQDSIIKYDEVIWNNNQHITNNTCHDPDGFINFNPIVIINKNDLIDNQATTK